MTSAPDATAATVAAPAAQSAQPGANRRPAIATNHTTAQTRSTGEPLRTDAVWSDGPMAMTAERYATTTSSATHTGPRSTVRSGRQRSHQRLTRDRLRPLLRGCRPPGR